MSVRALIPQQELLMKGVILAAGDGGRLRPLTDECPKVLLPLWGRPLIAYPLDAMMAAGIRDIAVVVGYRAPQVIEQVSRLVPAWARVEFIHNLEYDGGNAVSVAVAESHVGDSPFVLSMGDHVIDPLVIQCLMGAGQAASVLAVDSLPKLDSQLNDATRVLVNERGELRRIGKGLTDWNAVDIGVFRFHPEVFGVIGTLRRHRGVGLELNEVMQCLADAETPVATQDVKGLYWTDVDTVEDYLSVVGG